nr:MAG TPA: hypothetical protein [Caudoviricetes sp.]
MIYRRSSICVKFFALRGRPFLEQRKWRPLFVAYK